GCQRSTTSRYSIYCSRHQSRLRRQGDVGQEAVTKADLKTYIRLVRQRAERNSENLAWNNLDERWRGLVSYAQSILGAAQRGVVGNSNERIAAREVVKLAEHVEPREVVETVLAMFMLEQDQPRRFRSDPAFRTQLVRRTRGLSEVNAGTWYDAATGKTKRAY